MPKNRKTNIDIKLNELQLAHVERRFSQLASQVSSIDVMPNLSDQSISVLKAKLDGIKSQAVYFNIKLDEAKLDEIENSIKRFESDDHVIEVNTGGNALISIDELKDGVKLLRDELDSELGSSLDGVTEKAVKFRESLASGDQEKTLESFQEMREELNLLAEKTGEMPPELIEFNKELDNVRKNIVDKKVFKKMAKDASDAERKLKLLSKLRTSQKFASIAKGAKSAGEGLSSLGDSTEGTVSKVIDGVETFGNVAGELAQGFASGGPIGLGIAAVSVAVGFFTAEAKKAEAAVKKAFGGEITGEYKRSQESIDKATKAVEKYKLAQDEITDSIDEQNRKLQANLDIELQRAQNLAEIDNNKLAVDKIKILRDRSISEEERVKKLANIEAKIIRNNAAVKIKSLNNDIKVLQDDLKDQESEVVRLQNIVGEKENRFAIDDSINGNDQKKYEEAAKSKLDKFKSHYLGISKLHSAALLGESGLDEQEVKLDEILEHYSNLPNRDDKEIKYELTVKLLEVVNTAKHSSLDNDEKTYKSKLQDIVASYHSHITFSEAADKAAHETETFKKNLEKNKNGLNNARKNLTENDESINKDIILAREEISKINIIKKQNLGKVNFVANLDLKDLSEKKAMEKKEQEKEEAERIVKEKEAIEKQKEREKETRDSKFKGIGSELLVLARKEGVNNQTYEDLEKEVQDLADGTTLAEGAALEKSMIKLYKALIKKFSEERASTVKLIQMRKQMTLLRRQIQNNF